jgi:YVTN family beta-propeller protein
VYVIRLPLREDLKKNLRDSFKAIIQIIQVLLTPYGIAISPDGQWVYVTNMGSGALTIINTKTNTIEQTLDMGFGSQPVGVAFTPDGSRAFVATSKPTDLVSTLVWINVIDTAQMSLSAKMEVNGFPSFIAVSPDGSRIYTPVNDSALVPWGSASPPWNPSGPLAIVDLSNVPADRFCRSPQFLEGVRRGYEERWSLSGAGPQ